ncbi:elongation factor 1-delta-like isoform X2 [Saccoglossus kowalevskii]|uniref:Elongation factor 1-delta-like isoform X2 n=1 Tax=Saccoglossus kowalevskii TaxID=10224 RepID=A0ABM0M3K4_SACKO|nr:PREDICTED: elongation factor 1-delta-like isoform X2 [Saccoglossus kowalevskii]
MSHPLMQESIWFEKFRCDDAERNYEEHLAKQHSGLVVQGTGLAVGLAVENSQVSELKQRLSVVERENKDLKRVTQDLQAAVSKLQSRVIALEKGSPAASSPAPATKVEEKEENGEEEEDDDDNDDDIDLFGSDDDEEAENVKQERLKAYADRKAKKGPGPIAKSSLVLDVKPWDDETDMNEVEKLVRTIKAEGLLWGAAKLVPVGYGIKKLQISCVIEDDKIGTDFLEESITGFEDFVQSVDVAAFNKI